MKFNGKVAVVTGAASGIGRAIAERMASEGARVAAVDSDAEALARIPEELGIDDDQWLSLPGDVTDEAAVGRSEEVIAQTWERIDILVTSAGISFGGKVLDTSVDDWDRTFSVNVKGTFLWVKVTIPHMIASGGGSIITIASQLARAGGRTNAAYVSSKGAVISLTQSIALDYVSEGIRANSLLPGATETPLLKRSFARQLDPDAAKQRSLDRHPMHRFGLPREIADAAAFLASDEASFITGASLPVEGGWLVG